MAQGPSARGNRINDVTTAATRVASYATTSNRITGMTQGGAALRTYTYDTAGNIITDLRPGAETFAYSYNNRNRLASVTRNGVAYATYIYNAMEQLVSRNTAASGGPVGTVHYIYDTDGHLIAEANGSTGATTREYLWLPSNDNSNDTMAESLPQLAGGGAGTAEGVFKLPLAVIEGTTLTHIHSDHLGRPVRMTDAAKATVWQATYKPFGEVHSVTGTLAQNLRFPGQYFQIETGLAYNWHRHYDAVTGRYTQTDPLRFVDGPSIYAYVGNSPFMKIDRTGLTEWIGPAAGAVVNESGDPISIGGTSGGKSINETVLPGGKSSGSWWQDWDFAWVQCKCVKIGGGQKVFKKLSRVTPLLADESYCKDIPKPSNCYMCK